MPRGWRVLGHPFSVTCANEAAQSHFERLFGGLPRSAESEPLRVVKGASRWALETGGGVVSCGTFEVIVDALLAYLRDQAVRSIDDRTALLHAAAVAYDGCAALLPGPSGAGKSSLAVAMSQRPGWEFLGDEIIGLTRDGRVIPCPLPARLGQATRRLLDRAEPGAAGKRYVGADRAPTADDYRLGAVVFPRFSPTAATVLTPTTRGESVARLAAQMFPVRPRLGLDVAVGAVAGAEVYDLPYGDLFMAAELLGSMTG